MPRKDNLSKKKERQKVMVPNLMEIAQQEKKMKNTTLPKYQIQKSILGLQFPKIYGL